MQKQTPTHANTQTVLKREKAIFSSHNERYMCNTYMSVQPSNNVLELCNVILFSEKVKKPGQIFIKSTKEGAQEISRHQTAEFRKDLDAELKKKQ